MVWSQCVHGVHSVVTACSQCGHWEMVGNNVFAVVVVDIVKLSEFMMH